MSQDTDNLRQLAASVRQIVDDAVVLSIEETQAHMAIARKEARVQVTGEAIARLEAMRADLRAKLDDTPHEQEFMRSYLVRSIASIEGDLQGVVASSLGGPVSAKLTVDKPALRLASGKGTAVAAPKKRARAAR